MTFHDMPLSELPQPFIVCVLTEQTVEETVTTMKLAHYDGTDAYELNLPPLAQADSQAVRRIFATVDRPVYTSCRRADFMTVYGLPRETLPDWHDTERMQHQLEALALGSVAIDMEMDTFDPRPAPPLNTPDAAAFAQTIGEPAEVTYDPDALARQQEIIAAAHQAGGEVILSCHTGRPQSSDQLVSLVELAVERKADLVKIVSPCLRLADLLALLEATARLKTQSPVPYILVGAGINGMLSRTIGVTLGSGWALAQQTLKPGGFHDQPLVAHLREIVRLLPWRYEGL